jgi:hypothetical protein
MNERFTSADSIVYQIALMLLVLFLIGFYQNPTFGRHTLIGCALGALLIIGTYYSHKYTYLEIRDKRTLVNRGYHTFRYDTLDIYDIKYIYRVPAFIHGRWGSLMVIYLQDQTGTLKHSAVREHAYSNDSLKQFLTRIKEINPSIELDTEYEEFLAGTLGPQNEYGFKNIKTKNTVKSVEDRLRTKGEKF